jgi:hypothetical protein
LDCPVNAADDRDDNCKSSGEGSNDANIDCDVMGELIADVRSLFSAVGSFATSYQCVNINTACARALSQEQRMSPFASAIEFTPRIPPPPLSGAKQRELTWKI